MNGSPAGFGVLFVVLGPPGWLAFGVALNRIDWYRAKRRKARP